MTESAHRLRVILLGDSGVGKSSILDVLLSKGKDTVLDQQVTIGCNYDSIRLKLEDFLSDQDTKKAYLNLIQDPKKKIRLEIWDTSGQERFLAVTRLYFRNVQGVAIVYDLNDSSTFEGVKRWIQDYEQTTGNLFKDIPAIIVANKVDLVDTKSSELVQMIAQTQQLASQYNKPFYITSMLFDNHQVSELHVRHIFSRLVESIVQKYVITRSSDIFEKHRKIVKLENQREEKKEKQTKLTETKTTCSC